MATEKITGVDILVKVNTGTEETPEWTTVGGQRDATLNLNSTAIDVTSKDSDGWAERINGINDWGIEFGALYVPSDVAYEALETAYMEREQIMVQLAMPSGKTYSGKGIISLSITGPYNAEATYSGSITAASKLTKGEE